MVKYRRNVLILAQWRKYFTGIKKGLATLSLMLEID